MMAYGFGLKESEVDNASPRFLSLYLRGNIERDNELIKLNWEQARFVASTMSKGAAKIKFPWERAQYTGAVEKIPKAVWDKFTIN